MAIYWKQIKYISWCWLALWLASSSCDNSFDQPQEERSEMSEQARDDSLSLIGTHLQKARTAGEAGQLDTAIYWYAKASDIFVNLGEWDSLYVTARTAFYMCYYGGDFSPAKSYFLNFTKPVPPAFDTVQAKMLGLSGFLAYAEGKPEGMLDFYKPAAAIWERYPPSGNLGGTYNMLGIAYEMLEDYPLAEQFYREGVRVCLQTKDTVNASRNYSNLGLVQLNQSKWEAAIESFEKSQEFVPVYDGFYENNLASAYTVGERYDTALLLAQKALLLTNEFEGRRHIEPRDAYQTIGDVYIATDDFANAEKYYRKRLELAMEDFSRNHRERAKAHIDLGEAYQGQELWNLALRENQSAIEIFLPAFEPGNITDCPSGDSLFSREGYLMEALRNKGAVLLKKHEQSDKLNELVAASKHFQAAVQFINQVRLYHTEAGAKTFYGDQYSIPYVEDAIDAQLVLADKTGNSSYQEEAFELAQEATAFLLRESINDDRAMRVADVSQDTVQLLAALNKAISDHQTVVSETEIEATRDSLGGILFQLKRDRLALLEQLENAYPDYYELKHALTAIPLAELQAAIDTNTMVLKYFMGKERLYTFTFTKTQFSVYTTLLDNAFLENVTNYRQTLSDLDYIREYPEAAEQQFLQSSQFLYGKLVAPALEALEEEGINKLSIIPDGILNYISFECLLSKPVESWLEVDAFLIKEYAMRYAYYAGLLLTKEENPSLSENRFLGFGTEYDDKTLDALNVIEQDSVANPAVKEALRDKNLSKLAYADDEVREAADFLSGKAFLNEKATKSNFLQYTPGFEVIHIATHSFIDTENDSTAYIVFNQSSQSEDFLLSLQEIYNLDLDANLVALSGCQTGTGALQRSEGVMSLARAFRFAGSNSLLASQWSISDRASSQIMQVFYQHLDQGMSKSEALQQAKLAYLSDDNLSSPAYRIPAYWGAIVLIGEDLPLEFKSTGVSWYYWLFGGAVLALIAVRLFWKYPSWDN